MLRPLYNVYFHPLRKYPGPKLWAASSIPWGFKFMSGDWHHTILDLHRQYGHVIRIGPNELSYDGRKEIPKPTWYLSPRRKEIVGAEEQDHDGMRKLLGPGFTAISMYDQEPLVKRNVDLLMDRFAERTRDGGGETKLDIILEWLSFCTFDIIADMTFGETFGCLRESRLHPWLAWAFDDIKLSHKLVLSFRIPFFAIFLPLLDIWRLWRNARRFETNMRGYIDQRLARDEPEQWDFVQLMRKKRGNIYMKDEELYRNTGLLTLAGSETTCMTSTVELYYIGTYPEVKAKISKELADAFTSEEDINLHSAAKLPYLMAVIEESMRHHPPGPNSLWRVTPPGGNRVMGDFVPGNTVLGVPHRVMYRSEHNFKHADQFIPERWMDNSENSPFSNDRREAFHPFSYGPRVCLAMNLAYAEMRYILARLLWNFNFEIKPDCRDWTTSLRSWLIWETTPLCLVLKPKKR
ncbi:cytochrome P450 [Pseudomassariella vexata]|uniref:Cytochrome P450 n=1 Tax=Pseudomassariella vexata TaxID=1141098 RepID=A0A1Y2EHC4_9PEZI|nr:cytochrome P450 [Pseudomassariella vexata]ORY70969.1 cytochrome P450 [Pseudomassariella vexata]